MCDVDRLARDRDLALRQILISHTEGAPDDGLTYCAQCRYHWPCPPIVLARAVRELSSL